jgi:hypothetical protein
MTHSNHLASIEHWGFGRIVQYRLVWWTDDEVSHREPVGWGASCWWMTSRTPARAGAFVRLSSGLVRGLGWMTLSTIFHTTLELGPPSHGPSALTRTGLFQERHAISVDLWLAAPRKLRVPDVRGRTQRSAIEAL